MKAIYKILVIIVVAVLVGGVFYGVVTTSFSGTDQSTSSFERPAPADGFSPPDREGGADGIQFPAESIKNLAIISVVGVIYLNTARWLGRKKRTVEATL